MESDISWAVAAAITIPMTAVLILVGFFVKEIARRGADGRLRRNRIAGLRSPATLRSDEAWLAGHQAGLDGSLRGGTTAIVVAVSSFAVAWLVGALGVAGPDGVLFTWSAILLTGVIVMSIQLLRSFMNGNNAARELTESHAL